MASSTLRSDRKAPCALRAPAMSDGFRAPGRALLPGRLGAVLLPDPLTRTLP